MTDKTIIETINKVDTLGKIVQGLILDNDQLRTMVMGDHSVIKRMTEFPGIIADMQEEAKKAEENRENKPEEDKKFENPDDNQSKFED